MGRDTWFYKLDKIKAKEILLPELKNSAKASITFKNFCASEKWISPSCFDEVMSAVSNDINQVDPESLWVIIKYISLNVDHSLKEIETTLNHYGINEILYVNRSDAYALMSHLNDHFIDFEYNVKRNTFLMFVDYMILLSAEFAIKTNVVDDKLQTYIAEANVLKEKRKNESRIQRALDEEIPIIYKEWQEIEQKGDWHQKITFPYDYWFCYFAYGFLIQFSNIKNEIKSEHTNILIIDSI